MRLKSLISKTIIVILCLYTIVLGIYLLNRNAFKEIIDILYVMEYFIFESGEKTVEVKSNFNPILLDETLNIDTSPEFNFTISPNDKWLLFLKYQRSNGDYELCLFDLEKNKLHSFNDIKGSIAVNILENKWSKDNRYFIVDSPRSNAPYLIVDMNDPDNPETIYNYMFKENRVTHEQLHIAEYTCADCYDRSQREIDLYGKAIISSDRKKLYYAKGNGTTAVSICEYDRATSNEIKLTSLNAKRNMFGTPCIQVQLRLSPNQRFLAYEVEFHSCNGGWLQGGIPELSVVDLNNKKNYILKKDFHSRTAHWNARSDRLYFIAGKFFPDEKKEKFGIHYVDLSNLK